MTGKQVSAQEFGTTLADALITGDVATMFNEARSRGAVRVRLNMTNEPELLRIPWEFLRRNGMDLASHRDSTIVRELETAEPARPHHVEGKIRMLGVIANPKGDLDVAGEKSRVEEAIAKCSDRIELEWLENCTYQSLQRKLLDTVPHPPLRRARRVHRRGRGDPAAERRDRADEGGAGQRGRPVDRRSEGAAARRPQLV